MATVFGKQNFLPAYTVILIFGESSIKSLSVLKVFWFICIFRSSLVVHLSL